MHEAHSNSKKEGGRGGAILRVFHREARDGAKKHVYQSRMPYLPVQGKIQ